MPQPKVIRRRTHEPRGRQPGLFKVERPGLLWHLDMISIWVAELRDLKERCVSRHEFETLDQAREVIAAYIRHYHDRPHGRLDYRTPHDVRVTWAMLKEHYKHCGLTCQRQAGALQRPRGRSRLAASA